MYMDNVSGFCNWGSGSGPYPKLIVGLGTSRMEAEIRSHNASQACLIIPGYSATPSATNHYHQPSYTVPPAAPHPLPSFNSALLLPMGILGHIKNVTGGYTSSQKLVRGLTSNDENVPSTSEMREVSELTYDEHEMLLILDVIDKRLNDKGKYWRHVYKSLLLLDFLVRFGSDSVIQWCHENLYLVKTLREFQYRDDSGREVGGDIRQLARELSALIMDNAKLEDLRSRRRKRPSPRRYRGSSESERPPRQPSRPAGSDDDEELRRALELSKETAAQEEERRRMAGKSADTDDLQHAYNMTQQNQADMMFAQQRQAQEEAALAQAQAEYLATQQQAQAEAQRLYEMQQQQLQQQYLQQQQEAYLMQQQQLLQQQQQQQQPQQLQPLQQTQQTQQPLKTGSNNPFAAFNAQQVQPQQPQQQRQQEAPLEMTPTGSRPRLHRQSTFDKDHMDRLDQILSLDAPMDTFGNTGMAKMPAQHTQNTGFVNSSGHGLTQTLTARKTGLSSNPFNSSSSQPHSSNPQYTGIAATQMQPAHTGFGFGNASHSSTNLIDL